MEFAVYNEQHTPNIYKDTLQRTAVQRCIALYYSTRSLSLSLAHTQSASWASQAGALSDPCIIGKKISPQAHQPPPHLPPCGRPEKILLSIITPLLPPPPHAHTPHTARGYGYLGLSHTMFPCGGKATCRH